MHCRADGPWSNPSRAILNFFLLKNWRDLDFYEQKFQETQKYHVRKVKCLVRATERKMSVWRMETSDTPTRSLRSKVSYHPIARRARWPKSCKYHCQNSSAISRISGKDLPWLTREQILTSATCRLLRIIRFVKDRYLRICAKHAFNKVALKPLHHLKNNIFSKNFEIIQNAASLVTACRFWY